jgi:succinate dehydrogenase (ubiquinone) membrane anchor subunit
MVNCLTVAVDIFTTYTADSSKQLTSWFHKSGIVLAVLAPVAVVASPSAFNMPVELVLSVLFPFHSHVALNYVITDYVPPAGRTAARGALLAASVIAAVGMVKLTFDGPGLTESVKSLWRAPKGEKPVEKPADKPAEKAGAAKK